MTFDKLEEIIKNFELPEGIKWFHMPWHPDRHVIQGKHVLFYVYLISTKDKVPYKYGFTFENLVQEEEISIKAKITHAVRDFQLKLAQQGMIDLSNYEGY